MHLTKVDGHIGTGKSLEPLLLRSPKPVCLLLAEAKENNSINMHIQKGGHSVAWKQQYKVLKWIPKVLVKQKHVLLFSVPQANGVNNDYMGWCIMLAPT